MAVDVGAVAGAIELNDKYTARINEAATKSDTFAKKVSEVERAAAGLGPRLDDATASQGLFNKLITDFTDLDPAAKARAYADAVEFVGGKAKLSADQLREFERVTAAAGTSVKGAGEEAKAASGWFDDLHSHVGAMAVGFVAASAVVGAIGQGFRTLKAFVGDSIESFASAEAASKKMQTALENQAGHAVPDTVKQYDALATQFQATSTFSDDLINNMEALFTEIGNVGPSKMEAALTAATNLSAGLGIDLESAVRLVAKATEGHTEAFAKYGIQIDKAKVATEGADAVFESINARFGGQAQAQLETYSGQVQQLANDWDNVKEAVGKAIVQDPLLQAALATAREGIFGVAQAAAESTPTITDFWLAVAGRTTATPLRFALGVMSAEQKTIHDLAAEAEKLRAGLPKADPGFILNVPAQNFDLINKKAKEFADATAANWKKADDAAKKHVEELKRIEESYTHVKEVANLTQTFEAMERSGKANETQLKAIATQAADLQKKGAVLSPTLFDLVVKFDLLFPKAIEGAGAIASLGEKFDGAAPKATALANATDALAGKIHDGISGEIGFKATSGLEGFTKKAKEAKDPLDVLARAISQLATTSTGSFATVVKGIGSVVTSLDTAKKGIDLFQSGKKEGGLGGLLNMASGVTGVFSAIVAGASIVKSVLGSLFGTAGRTDVTKFATEQGGFDALHAKLIATGAGGEALWVKLTQGVGRNNPQQAKAVIDEITAAFDKQKNAAQAAADAIAPTFDNVSAAAAAYGLTLDQLGPKVSQLDITEQANATLKNFQILDAAGADMGVVFGASTEKVQGLVTRALQSGAELPEAFRPFLQQMVDAGLLTDDTGKKLEDLSGIKFATPLVDAMKDLVTTMKDFIGTVTGKGGATDALDKLSKTKIAPIRIPYYYDPEGNPVPVGGTGPTPPSPGRPGMTVTVNSTIEIDGREVARSTAPHLASELELQGV